MTIMSIVGWCLLHGRTIALTLAIVTSLTGFAASSIHKRSAENAEQARITTAAALNASQAARKAEQEHAAKVQAAYDKLEAQASARADEDNIIRNEVNRAKLSNACSTSPAVRRMLDGMRKPQPTAPGRAASQPGRASASTGVPPRTKPAHEQPGS